MKNQNIIKNKICILVGTRPEIIKMTPIIKECARQGLNFFIVHTGQHYSFKMDRIFMKELSLPKPKYNLNAGSGLQGAQTAKILESVEKVFLKEKPTVVLVQGDTNSVLAGALAARKLNIKIGHVEAGLRSYDNRMPEETNRIIADHLSDYLFVPTMKSVGILKKEGLTGVKIHVTGNTIVDAVFCNIKIASKKSNILKKYGLHKKSFLLLTSHRAENVDIKKGLTEIIKALEIISKQDKLSIVWPIHPRTSSNIAKFNLKDRLNKILGLKIIEPVGYFDSLILQQNAKMVMTDSGGLQEESCILGTPCITLRENTERPESVEVGGNILAGVKSTSIIKAYKIFSKNNKKWKNPFGSGDSAKKIISILKKDFS